MSMVLPFECEFEAECAEYGVDPDCANRDACDLYRTCGHCQNLDFDTLLCDFEDEDGTREKVTPETPACSDWEELHLSEEEAHRRLKALSKRMWWHVVEHNKRQVPGVDMSGFERPLKELGVDVWKEEP